MAQLNDLDDVTISNPKVGDVVKYTATGWQNGADATGTPVGGNPCGDLTDYTKRNRKETIIEPWVWDLKRDTTGPLTDDVITVKDEQGNIGYFGPRRTRNANDQGFVKMQILDDGQGLIQSQNTLSFVDSQVPNGVTLAELIAGTGAGGVAGQRQEAIAGKFQFNNDTAPLEQSFKKWDETPNLDSEKRLIDWKVSDPLALTLPDWATGAVIVHVQNQKWNFSDDITENPVYGIEGQKGVFRQYTTHKIGIDGAGVFTVGIGGDPGRDLMVSTITSNIAVGVGESTIKPGNRMEVTEHTNYQIIRLTGSNKTITLTHSIDVLRGGWNKLTCGTGKVFLIPIVWDQNNIYSLPNNNGFSGRAVSDQEYLDLLDTYFPPMTSEELLLEDTQTLKSGIVYALNICNDALAQTPGDATIEGIRSNLYALKDETTLAFAEARFKVLIGELRAALAWKFDWEPAGYSLV